MCVYGGHLTVTPQKNKLTALLRRMHRYRFASEIYDIKTILSDMDLRFFSKMRNDTRCINSLLPCNNSTVYGLRAREHHFELPPWNLSFFRNSFVMRCVYNYK